MIEAIGSLLLGLLTGRLAGAAYFAALGCSVRRLDKGAIVLVSSAAARLAVIIGALAFVLALGADAMTLGAVAIGFVLARRAAIAAVLGKRRAQP